MVQEFVPRGVRIPDGFVTPVDVHREFLDAPVDHASWQGIEVEDRMAALRAHALRAPTLAGALRTLFEHAPAQDHLEMHGRTELARAFVKATPLPEVIADAIREGYASLCSDAGREVEVAVRSSATREDSEVASFAGQYDSFLNIRGADAVLDAWKRCAASAFTERAVNYQLGRDMDPLEGGLGVVIMRMVRSDIATSGVMFTLDPDSGNRNVIHVSSSYGLGELVVQGVVSPDTFLLWKGALRQGRPALVHRWLGAKDRKLIYSMQGGTATESVDVGASRRRQWSLDPDEVQELGRMALLIEDYYGRPVDIEWAKDGYSGDLFIVQARPETVHSSNGPEFVLETYRMPSGVPEKLEKEGRVLLRGHAVGTRIGAGRARVYRDYEEVIVRKRALRNRLAEGTPLDEVSLEDRVFDPGDVLVTELTTPDWEPMMKEASLIVTEKGGRTSHAAIVARELGIPAIVGCGADATQVIKPLMEVTGSCAEGETAVVYEGIHPFEIERVEIQDGRDLDTKIKLNVGFPTRALQDAMLPSDGVGLARLEFILTAQVGVHPLALLYFDELRRFADNGEVAEVLGP